MKYKYKNKSGTIIAIINKDGSRTPILPGQIGESEREVSPGLGLVLVDAKEGKEDKKKLPEKGVEK